MGWSLNHLLIYKVKGDALLSCIVAGDESWCHLFELSNRPVSMQCKHPRSPKDKKFKSQTSIGKVMLTAFFFFFLYHERLLLVDFKEPHMNITANHDKGTRDKLHKAIKNKQQQNDFACCESVE